MVERPGAEAPRLRLPAAGAAAAAAAAAALADAGRATAASWSTGLQEEGAVRLRA